FPHDPAHGILHKKIVTDQVSRHSARSPTQFWTNISTRKNQTRYSIGESGGFCCQVPPDPALKCYLQGLHFGATTALRGKSHRSIVVVSTYKVGSDDGGPMPGKRSSFTLPVDPISPPPKLATAAPSFAPSVTGFGGGAGYRPRVRRAYFDTV